jgi:hypothetical protein
MFKIEASLRDPARLPFPPWQKVGGVSIQTQRDDENEKQSVSCLKLSMSRGPPNGLFVAGATKLNGFRAGLG